MKISDSLKKPIIVDEYGSWVMFIIPVTSAAILRCDSIIKLLWFFVAALAVFLLYRPAEILSQEILTGRKNRRKMNHAWIWFFIYGIIAAAFGFSLVIYFDLYQALTLFLGAAMFFALSQLLHNIYKSGYARDIPAILGITMFAPITDAVFTNTTTSTGLLLWLLNALFFLSSAFFVHLQMASVSVSTERKVRTLKAKRLSNIIFHAVLSLTLASMTLFHLENVFILLAFLPMLIHVFLAGIIETTRVNLKKTGMLLVLYALNFIVFTSIYFLP